MSTFSKADTHSQFFGSAYPGQRITPNCGVIHTTETSAWPGYGGGASAPHYTGRPDFGKKIINWRSHFADEVNSRALMNKSGGVETNTANAIQIELIGTCDPKYRTARTEWGRAGVDYIYWPEAPEWALRAVAELVRDLHLRHGIKLQGPTFMAYPASYGNSAVRMTFSQWRNFYGFCGHQHVPENDHGDPGNIDFRSILAYASKTGTKPKVIKVVTDTVKKVAKKKQRKPRAHLTVDGDFGYNTIRATQRIIGVRVDGDWGPASRRGLQKYLKVRIDGDIGPTTVRALQKRVRVRRDGEWGPATTRGLQRALNAGRF